MIKKLKLENFGAVSLAECGSLGSINLVIGPNQSGKTTLLKALYASVKTVEQHKRGRDIRSDKEILGDKLFWTFQSRQLGNIVRKGESSLSFSMASDKDETFAFSFGTSTTKSPAICANTFAPRDSNSIFISAKEILSWREIVMDARNRYSKFDFDDTYLDLARALTPTTKGKNYKAFADARLGVGTMIGGRLDYDAERKEWVFVGKDRKVYELSLTSEGVKKLAILDLLLGNHYLDNNSVIFIDEVEANLHPALIGKLMDIIVDLAKAGVQFFIASHSYFVIKKLYILAHQHKMSIPVLSFNEGVCELGNLKKNMPKNAIIDESVNLYKEEVCL